MHRRADRHHGNGPPDEKLFGRRSQENLWQSCPPLCSERNQVDCAFLQHGLQCGPYVLSRAHDGPVGNLAELCVNPPHFCLCGFLLQSGSCCERIGCCVRQDLTSQDVQDPHV